MVFGYAPHRRRRGTPDAPVVQSRVTKFLLLMRRHSGAAAAGSSMHRGTAAPHRHRDAHVSDGRKRSGVEPGFNGSRDPRFYSLATDGRYRGSRVGETSGMKPPLDPNYRHRFPAEIISHTVWLYLSLIHI